MKVALICPYDLGATGGVQDQVIRLSRWLEEAGHESLIVGPGDSGPPGAVLLGSTRVIRANAASTPIALDPRLGGMLRNAVEDCDVLHVHEPLMPVISLSASRIRRLPSVGTFHADAPPWARTAYRMGSGIVRAVLEPLDVVTAVSSVAESAVSSVRSVCLIPNGIDIGDYLPAAKVPGTVVFLGRDDPRKGLDSLLDAWPIVREKVPGAALTVLGAERSDVAGGVTYRGWVTEEEKQQVLGRSEVFVAPNLSGESFGIILAEAMAARCAIVASALPGFVGVLGESGEYVQPGDSVGLGEKIASLLNDSRRLEQLGSFASERVQRFDGSVVAADYIRAYEKAMALHAE